MKINLKKPKPNWPKIPKFNINSGSNKLKVFFKGVKAFSNKIAAFFKRDKVKMIISNVLIGLAIVAFLFELTFASLIYGFKIDNDFVKKVAKFIPFPMVLVNFNTVTLAEYNFESSYIEHFYNQSQREVPADIHKQIVDQLIDSKILDIKAPQYGVKITKEEVDDTISGLVEQSGGQAEVEKVLASYYGITLTDFRTLVKTQLLRIKMKDTVPVQIKASHILIKADKEADQATVDAAKAKADGIYAELVAGTDFAAKATAISDDTGSRDQGGDLGFFGRNDMVKPFEDKAFTMKVGDISEPIRTDYGWHIIKVTEKKGFEDQNFEDWIASIRNKSFIKQFVSFK